MSAWAWALSRVEDYFVTDPLVDSTKVALFGVSRLSVAVLWAAVKDRRFAAVVTCCTGKLGEGLMRRNFGSTIEGSNGGNLAHWVAKNLAQYYGRENELPVDGHMLLSLIAPRPVLLQNGKLDYAADPKGAFFGAVAASPVYQLLGGQGLGSDHWPPETMLSHDLAYYTHDGGHGLVEGTWEVYLEFLAQHLAE